MSRYRRVVIIIINPKYFLFCIKKNQTCWCEYRFWWHHNTQATYNTNKNLEDFFNKKIRLLYVYTMLCICILYARFENRFEHLNNNLHYLLTYIFSVLSHPFMEEHPFKDLEPLAIMASWVCGEREREKLKEMCILKKNIEIFISFLLSLLSTCSGLWCLQCWSLWCF